MARTREFDEIEVLDKAVDLFWRKGYNATSANDLVAELGLSRSSLYATFGDKRSLFVKSLDRYRRQAVQKMKTLVEESEDLPQSIAEIFRMVVDQDITAQIPKGCFIVNSSIELAPHDQEIAKIVNANMQDVESTFEMAIKKGQQKGQVSKSHSAKALARFLFNNISGLRVAVKSNNDKAALDDVIQVSLSVL